MTMTAWIEATSGGVISVLERRFRPSGEITMPVIAIRRETYTTPLLPGFELPLKELFAAADAYAGSGSDDD
jgi:hypothetical protein